MKVLPFRIEFLVTKKLYLIACIFLHYKYFAWTGGSSKVTHASGQLRATALHKSLGDTRYLDIGYL